MIDGSKMVLEQLLIGLDRSVWLREQGYHCIFDGNGLAIHRNGHVLCIINYAGSELTLYRAASSEPIANSH